MQKAIINKSKLDRDLLEKAYKEIEANKDKHKKGA